jgi:thioredoxin-related protein
MKNFFFTGLLCAVSIIAGAQNNEPSGVRFERNLTWTEIKAKAKTTNKFIFVDCYATWCGPCHQMDRDIFPTESVGKFMNAHFVSVQVQMDSTGHDSQMVNSWRPIGRMFMSLYHISAFPTFLIFNPEGEIVHKYIGSDSTVEIFVQKLAAKMDPSQQFYNLQRRYNSTKDVSLIGDLIASARDAQEKPGVSSKELISSVKDPFTRVNLEAIFQVTENTQDDGYKFFYKNRRRLDDTLGADMGEKYVRSLLSNDFIGPIFKLPPNEVSWSNLELIIQKRADPVIAKEVIAEAKYNYYGYKELWPQYIRTLRAYLQAYGHKVQPYLLNNLLWPVFLHADPTSIRDYLAWAKKPYEYDHNFIAGIDTYANFLYKDGKTEEALSWETKGLAVAQATNNKDETAAALETIAKMKAGKKTW